MCTKCASLAARSTRTVTPNMDVNRRRVQDQMRQAKTAYAAGDREEAERKALNEAARLASEVSGAVPALGSARNRSPPRAAVGVRGTAFDEAE